VRTLAEELGWTALEVADVNDPTVVERIRALSAHVGLVVAFGQKLKTPLIESTRGGLINLHASLLPKYRGAAPINWALIRGEERTGCTVFRIVERLDAGPILTTRWTAIKPEETAGELHDRLAGVGADAVDAALKLFEGDAVPEGTPQDEAEATRAPKLTKSDGFVRFNRSTDEIAAQIAGVTPWPGATARYESAKGRWEKVTITRARRAEGTSKPDAPPGTIDERRYVATSDGFLEILEIKPSSGRIMSWADYVNGRHVAPGDKMIPPQ
jgi:methionyl-tRNA formyltransferase